MRRRQVAPTATHMPQLLLPPQTAISVLGLMMQLGSGPFADSGGLAWPLLPLAGARLADAYGLTRQRDPLPRSAMVRSKDRARDSLGRGRAGREGTQGTRARAERPFIFFSEAPVVAPNRKN